MVQTSELLTTAPKTLRLIVSSTITIIFNIQRLHNCIFVFQTGAPLRTGQQLSHIDARIFFTEHVGHPSIKVPYGVQRFNSSTHAVLPVRLVHLNFHSRQLLFQLLHFASYVTLWFLNSILHLLYWQSGSTYSAATHRGHPVTHTTSSKIRVGNSNPFIHMHN